MLNFNWWVNRKDPGGKNVFEGGFLGLDNIGVFDRSAPLPTGGHLEQADGTAWMAFYCQKCSRSPSKSPDMTPPTRSSCEVRAALPLDCRLDGPGGPGRLWDEEDGFYYDVLMLPDELGPHQGAFHGRVCCR